MIASRFSYNRPTDMGEAVRLYQASQGEAVYLSGGTDLIPRIKLGLEKPQAVIDLKGLGSLRRVEDQGDWIRIGPLARLFELKQNQLIRAYAPALRASLEATSCESLQMRGTIGGNLLQNTRCLFYNQSEFWRRSKGFCLKMGGEQCNAVPGAKQCFANYLSDNAPALCSLSAEVEFYGPEGVRRMPLEDLYSDRADRPFDVQPSEILSAIFIPKKKGAGGYEKLRVRGAIDYPLLGVAITLADGTVRLVVGALGPKPLVFETSKLSRRAVMETAQAVLKQVRPVGNTVVEPDYRKRMIPVLVGRLADQVMEGAE
jgi:4-hydroxybenzoyl-CoA reductase subunit beta